jgi:hypothetical protein
MSKSELALLAVLATRRTLEWHAAARSTALDDDALCDAVEALLDRGAVRIVRAPTPRPVAIEITALGADAFARVASETWR